MQEGQVYKTTGSWYIVESEGKFYNARLKGKHKIDHEKSYTNPIAVGDKVMFTSDEKEGQDKDYMIEEILPRENYIVRSSPHNARVKHIIAANIDQAILLVTLKKPRTSLGFIDRFLVTAEMYHIPAILIFNKEDLYADRDIERYEELKAIYQPLGYEVEILSSLEGEIPDKVKKMLEDKTSLISGHSGSGKSTFINKLLPENPLQTQEVSQNTGKGMHTTTFAQAFDLPFGGTLIDTPGIKELGIVELHRSELADYYPEMRDLSGDCAFNDCLHVEEPRCAVKNALEEGKDISLIRYQNYRGILDSMVDEAY